MATMTIYIVFAIYLNRIYTRKMFQAISVVLLLVFLYFVGIYLEKRLKRSERMDREFPIYSRNLYPTMKYNIVDKK